MKYSVEDVASGVYQYFTGASLNEIRGHIEQQSGVRPSDSAVYGWVTRFSKLAAEKALEYQPKVGGTWVADETVLRIDGKRWLWDVIDADTRFLLATHLSTTRSTKDAQRLMELAAHRAGRTPEVVLTDKLAAYLDGIELTFGADTRHVQTKPFAVDGGPSTSLIERWHGTLKDRTKVMRGMKTLPSARVLLDGWLVYYNFFRPHEGLGGKTPAEASGIKFPYKNWLDVVWSESPTSSFMSAPPLTPVVLSVTYRAHTSSRGSRRRKRGRKASPPTLSEVRQFRRGK